MEGVYISMVLLLLLLLLLLLSISTKINTKISGDITMTSCTSKWSKTIKKMVKFVFHHNIFRNIQFSLGLLKKFLKSD